ncbi:MAG: hypothetical protein QM750_19885 [Rubrivivax sp.]
MLDAAADLDHEARHRLTTRLSRKPAHVSPPMPGDDAVLDGLVARVSLTLEVSQAAVDRMVALSHALRHVDADEISDWTIPVRAVVVTDDGSHTPEVIGVSSTVFADGEVHLSIYFDGLDEPLWCLLALDLSTLMAL